MEELNDNLFDLNNRIIFLKTFDGMCFFSLVIQNISELKDTNIQIVITIESGEIIEPNSSLICKELEGCQPYLCHSDDDDNKGIIEELFLLPSNSMIKYEESLNVSLPKIPITLPFDNSIHKTEDDYESELKQFIAEKKIKIIMNLL